VRDGIGGHSKGLRDLEPAPDPEALPATLEGQVVRLADRIAYVHHDMDDAVRAGIVRDEEVPAAVRGVLGPSRGEWLSRMVHDVVQQGQTARRPAWLRLPRRDDRPLRPPRLRDLFPRPRVGRTLRATGGGRIWGAEVLA